jgi:hypothetical protein
MAYYIKKYHMPNILRDLIDIYNACFPYKTDFEVLNKAIDQLSDLSKKLEKHLYPYRKQQKKLEEEKYAAQLPGALKSFHETWQNTLNSGKLPGAKDLRNFPVKEILRIFALGRVQGLTDGSGNLENGVSAEPAYLVKLLNTAKFVLEELVNGREFSVEFIKDIVCQCMKDTSKWEEDFKSHIRKNEDQWEYAVEMVMGFSLIYDNHSKAGVEELRAKYESRTGGTKTDSRYPEGHPIGDLCNRDPDIMVGGDKYYRSRALKKGEGEKYHNIIINKFNEEIQASDNDDQKLDAIVYCCQDLFQSHRLQDGNTRIIAGFILTFLLLKHGLWPAIIGGGDDKLFAIFSHEETKSAVAKGQKRAKKRVRFEEDSVQIGHGSRQETEPPPISPQS